MSKYEVKGLFKGVEGTLPSGQISAIRKEATKTLTINKFEIPGDVVVDQKHHGGAMRVIHHYSGKNYQHLKEAFPDIAERFKPGTFGENLYTDELNESELCIGDIFKLGTAKVQVTVPRRPCATINNTYEDTRVLKEVMNSGHVGWFYTVLEEGTVKIGDHLELMERPNPDFKLSRLFDQGYKRPQFSDLDFLNACYATNLMDKGWKPNIERVLNREKN